MTTHPANATAAGKRRRDIDSWLDEQCEPYRLHMETKKLKKDNDKLKEAFDLVYKTLQHNQKQHKSLRDESCKYTAYMLQMLCVHASCMREVQKLVTSLRERISTLEKRTPTLEAAAEM